MHYAQNDSHLEAALVPAAILLAQHSTEHREELAVSAGFWGKQVVPELAKCLMGRGSPPGTCSCCAAGLQTQHVVHTVTAHCIPSRCTCPPPQAAEHKMDDVSWVQSMATPLAGPYPQHQLTLLLCQTPA